MCTGAGVPEFWLVDPLAAAIEVLVLESGEYRSLGVFTGARRPPSRVLPDLDQSTEALLGR